MDEDEISHQMIGAATEGHKTLGGPVYLKLIGKKLGLLINFGRKSVKEGTEYIFSLRLCAFVFQFFQVKLHQESLGSTNF